MSARGYALHWICSTDFPSYLDPRCRCKCDEQRYSRFIWPLQSRYRLLVAAFRRRQPPLLEHRHDRWGACAAGEKIDSASAPIPPARGRRANPRPAVNA